MFLETIMKFNSKTPSILLTLITLLNLSINLQPEFQIQAQNTYLMANFFQPKMCSTSPEPDNHQKLSQLQPHPNDPNFPASPFLTPIKMTLYKKVYRKRGGRVGPRSTSGIRREVKNPYERQIIRNKKERKVPVPKDTFRWIERDGRVKNRDGREGMGERAGGGERRQSLG